MISRLRRLFHGPTESLREVDDPVLGRCVPDAEEAWWRASVEVGGRRVAFILGGDVAPDPALLAHARDIVSDLAGFEAHVREFLAHEAVRLRRPEIHDEIERLQLDDVCLFWPKRPDDGMIFFVGPSDERVWRCDYIDRECRNLGYDS